MLRKLALSLAVAAAVGTTQAHALGLGEIKVNSALNEPLDADIRLVQVRDLSPLQIRPRMADIDEFSLAGLTKSRFLSDVKFQVRVAPNGDGSIHVTSSVPVQEPFLSFLMEVNWPNGRLVREYTLLLDPPVFDPSPTTNLVSAPVSAQTAAPAIAPPAVRRPAPQATIRTNMDPKNEVYIDINDTLYVLARKYRPSSDISVEQMMIALQRKNPQAFPTSNINILKAGTVVRLPTAEEARALTRKQAVAEVARQTAEWKAGRRSAAPKPAPAVEEKAASGKPDSSAGAAVQAESDDQLKILSVDQKKTEADQSAEAADVPVAASDAQPSVREQALLDQNKDLEARLMVTQETVSKVEQENAEMGTKLDSIQEQLAALQRLIELKDQQMAALQAELLKQAQEANKPQASLLDDLINTLLQNPLYVGGAGGALVLLLALLALKRRRGRDEEFVRVPSSGKSKASRVVPEAEGDQIPDFASQSGSANAASIAATAAAAAAYTAANTAQADKLDEDELDNPFAADLNDQFDDQPDSLTTNDAELDDLDLDMDLDLDEAPTDPAFEPVTELSDEAAKTEAEIDSMLDEILVDEKSAETEREVDDLDALLDEDSDLVEMDDELSVSEAEIEAEMARIEAEKQAAEAAEAEPGDEAELEFNVEKTADDAESAAEDLEEAELEGLEFAVADQQSEAMPEDEGDFIDDQFFQEEIAPPSDAVKPTEQPAEEDFLDELLDSDEPPVASDRVAVADDLDDLLDDDLDKMLAASAAELAEAEAADQGADEAPQADQMASTDADVSLEEDRSVADVALQDDAEPMDFTFTDHEEEAVEEPVQAPVEEAPEALADEEIDIDALLDDTELSIAESESAGDQSDLDAMVAEIDAQAESGEQATRPKRPGELVEDELTANIAHDLELELDDELDQMLAPDDAEVELVEEGDEDLVSDASGFDMDMLDGTDEVETKLDLARAYIEMDDTAGARDILSEILQDGNAQQQAEAQKLIDKLS